MASRMMIDTSATIVPLCRRPQPSLANKARTVGSLHCISAVAWRGWGRRMDVLAPSMIRVREALKDSWDPSTAYRGAARPGVPSLGQCYPTSRVLLGVT